MASDPTSMAIFAIAILSILAVVLAIVYTLHNYHSEHTSTPVSEGFTMSDGPATVTPYGGITGQTIYTNGLTNGSASELIKAVGEQGRILDTSCMMQSTKSNINEVNDLYKSHLRVHEILDESKPSQGFQKVENLKAISDEMNKGINVKGLFKRQSNSTTLKLDPNATVGVIDQNYVAIRDRPKTLQAVKTAIPIPGFEFDNRKGLEHPTAGICDLHVSKLPGVQAPVEDNYNAVLASSLRGAETGNGRSEEENETLKANGIISVDNVA
jgi:hypothetical protein